jgi:hypothetical protein
MRLFSFICLFLFACLSCQAQVNLKIQPSHGSVYFTLASGCVLDYYNPYIGLALPWSYMHQGGCMVASNASFVVCLEYDGALRLRSVETATAVWTSDTRSAKAMWFTTEGMILLSSEGELVYSIPVNNSESFSVSDEGELRIQSNGRIAWSNGEFTQSFLQAENEEEAAIRRTLEQENMRKDAAAPVAFNGNLLEYCKTPLDESTDGPKQNTSNEENDPINDPTDYSSLCLSLGFTSPKQLWIDQPTLNSTGAVNGSVYESEEEIFIPTLAIPMSTMTESDNPIIKPPASAVSLFTPTLTSESKSSVDFSLVSTGLTNTFRSSLTLSKPALVIGSCLSNLIQTFYLCLESDGSVRVRSRMRMEQVYWDAGITGASELVLHFASERLIARSSDGLIIYSSQRMPQIDEISLGSQGQLVGLSASSELIWMNGQRIYTETQVNQALPQFELNQYFAIRAQELEMIQTQKTAETPGSLSACVNDATLSDLTEQWKAAIGAAVLFPSILSAILTILLYRSRHASHSAKVNDLANSQIV